VQQMPQRRQGIGVSSAVVISSSVVFKTALSDDMPHQGALDRTAWILRILPSVARAYLPASGLMSPRHRRKDAGWRNRLCHQFLNVVIVSSAARVIPSTGGLQPLSAAGEARRQSRKKMPDQADREETWHTLQSRAGIPGYQWFEEYSDCF